MLVPTPRFLFWFAGIVLPFSALGALYDQALGITAILIAGLLLAAALDAALALPRLRAFALELPPLVRISLGRQTAIDLFIRRPPGPPRRLRIGLEWPAALRPEPGEHTILVPAQTDRSSIRWPMTPLRRGRYRIERGHLETPSALGFWGVRHSVPLACEIRVYPNLERDRRQLASLFLHRGATGVRAQRQVGQGRDFEKLREYVAGDSYDEIHWKATAKRHHPVTKVFQIERTQEVYIVLDASRLSGRRPSPAHRATAPSVSSPSRSTASTPASGADMETPPALERLIEAGLILAQAAARQGDLFGLVTFAEQPGAFLRARNGHAHYAACRDALYTLETRNVSPDFDEVVSFLRTRLRRRALLMFLTSLDDPVLAESFVRNVTLLARQHLVVVHQVQPVAVAPLFSRADDVETIDDIYRHLGGHLQWQRLQELQRNLQHRGVRFSLVDQDRLALEMVAHYLDVKQRQLL